MKRYLSLALALILALSCFSAVCAEEESLTTSTKTTRIVGTLGANNTLTPDNNDSAVWDKDAGTYTWSSGRGKFAFADTPKFYIGRTYQLFIQMSAAALEDEELASDLGFSIQLNLDSTGSSGDRLLLQSTVPNTNGTFSGTNQHYQLTKWYDGVVTGNKKTFKSYPYNVTYVPATSNGGIYETLSKIQLWAKNGTAKFTVYGLDIEETVTYCDTKFNAGENGSVSVVSYADLDGENAVSNKSVADGEILKLEKNTKATVKFEPKSGYEIDTVTYGGESILVTDAAGFEAVLSVSEPAELNVTFKEKEVKAPTVTTGEPAVAYGYKYSDDYAPSNTIVGYATIDAGYGKPVKECGYYITNKDNITLTLPAVPVPTGTTYGIRMFGAGIVSGEYKVQPYIKLSDDKIITGDEKVVTIE